ncbi:MAG: polysaccharide biosynthesis protein [Defluviitaleaceae bacterium]|nr:polysaccharide biosynthesis protein [Defluviitaleaceae bacterium]
METKRENSGNNFVRQAVILAFAGIFARILGFVYRVPLTDLIGDDGNAIYGVSFDIYAFLLILSSAGLPAAIAKMVAERRAAGRADQAHRVFRLALTLAAGIGFILSVFTFIFARQIATFMNFPEATLALQLLTPTVFIVAIMAVFRGYFQGMANTKPTAFSQIIEQIFNAVLSIILAHSLWNFAISREFDEFAYGAAGGTLGSTLGAVAGLLAILGLYFLLRKDIMRSVYASSKRRRTISQSRNDSGAEPTSVLVKTIFATSFTIILGTAIFSVANLSDTLIVTNRLQDAGFDESHARELLGQLKGKFYTITNIPAAITSALAIAIIPAISAANAIGNRIDVHNKINTGMRVGMFITIPIAFGLAVLGPQITELLFPNHPEGGTLFTWGFVSVIFLGISQITTGVLQALGKAIVPIYAALLGAVAKIVSNLILIGIPEINIYGAVIGTTICFSLAATVNCVYLFKYTCAKFDLKGIIIKPIFASVAMGMGVYTFYHITNILIGRNAPATIIAIVVGAVFYAIFMLLLKGIGEEEILYLPFGKKILRIMQQNGII